MFSDKTPTDFKYLISLKGDATWINDFVIICRHIIFSLILPCDYADAKCTAKRLIGVRNEMRKAQVYW